MIAPKDSIEPQASDVPAVAGIGDPGLDKSSDSTAITDRGYNLPNSRKVYLPGELHPNLRVPFREISLAPTKTMSGEMEVNESVRVYDTSGPWGDAGQNIDVKEGLPALRAQWIRDRADVEEIEGRTVTPIDDGYLSDKHAASSNGRNGNLKSEIFNLQSRKPFRAKPGNCVT
ncbi:MAG: phosphomethylpyrimidine synthase, partial [Verrucomicrobiota bacterium]